MFFRQITTILGSLGILFAATFPSQAQTCVPLQPVDSEATSVRKTVFPINNNLVGDDWDTVFSIPGGVQFQGYIVSVVPEDAGNYSIEVDLEYSDDTTDEIFDGTNLTLSSGEEFTITAYPRRASQPYQVNVEVGGLEAIDKTYMVSVVGCYE